MAKEKDYSFVFSKEYVFPFPIFSPRGLLPSRFACHLPPGGRLGARARSNEKVAQTQKNHPDWVAARAYSPIGAACAPLGHYPDSALRFASAGGASKTGRTADFAPRVTPKGSRRSEPASAARRPLRRKGKPPNENPFS